MAGLPILIGDNQRNSDNSRSAQVPAKRSRSDAGNSATATGGMSVPAAPRQKRVSGSDSHHQRRQRITVCRLAPTSSCSSRIRLGLAPQRIAEISTTTANGYTFGPRKRTEGGMRRLRHSRFAQQKLKRLR